MGALSIISKKLSLNFNIKNTWPYSAKSYDGGHVILSKSKEVDF